MGLSTRLDAMKRAFSHMPEVMEMIDGFRDSSSAVIIFSPACRVSFSFEIPEASAICEEIDLRVRILEGICEDLRFFGMWELEMFLQTCTDRRVEIEETHPAYYRIGALFESCPTDRPLPPRESPAANDR